MYSDACKIATDFDAKCKYSEASQVAHEKSLSEAKWLKPRVSWNITIMHFQNYKLSFFSQALRYLVISTLSEWNPSPFPHFEIFTYNSGTVSNQEKSYNKRYVAISFSKYSETSPELVYSWETSGTVIHAKFELISTQNALALNQDM